MFWSLQPTVTANPSPASSGTEYLLLYLVIILLLFGVPLVWLYLRKRQQEFQSTFAATVLHVRLPRFDKTGKDRDEHKWQELLGIAESFYASLGGIKPRSGLFGFFKQSNDHISFEIVADRSSIKFYVVVPLQLKRFIIQQLHAQYPYAHITEIPDYNIFRPTSHVLASYLTLTKRSAFPIKTYRQMDSDPLNSVLNSLGKLQPNESAAIQILVRPVRSPWRLQGREIVKKIQSGEKLSNLDFSAKTSARLMNFFVENILTNWSGKAAARREEKEHHLSPLEQKTVESIEEKIAKAGLETNIRVVVATESDEQSRHYLSDITNTFSAYNIYEYGNSFHPLIFPPNSAIATDFIYRRFQVKRQIVLNTEELASLYHFPLPHNDAPNLEWLEARRAEPPQAAPQTGLYLGKNIYRNEETDIFIKPDDRRRHTYILGQTGTGKSNLMENLISQDIKNGHGCCLIDPHGDLAQTVLAHIPPEREQDVIYFNPADTAFPLSINMLEFSTPEQKTFVVNELLQIFDKLYDLKATGGPMFEQYMRNAVLLVMEDVDSGMTLLEIPKVLSDVKFRKLKLSKCKNPAVIDFWEKEAEQAGGEAALANMVPYITSKLTPFIANDLMRPIISRQHSSFDFREIMDSGKILIVNLSKGKLGDLNSKLLGMIVVGKILMAALSRAELPEEQRRDFYLYIDEFQNFTTESIAIILSEARKYRLNLIIANQYLSQLTHKGDASIRDAVFGNVGTFICFRIGIEDAEIVAKQLAPVFTEYDVVNIPKFSAYIKLLVDNANPPAFNIDIGKAAAGEQAAANRIIQLSQNRYGQKA